MSHYLTEPLALTAFVDNLSNNYGELDHHFRSSLGRIVMNKASLALLQEPREEVSPEDLATYQRLINQAYRYKAFIRELVIRWSA
jgi:hypothetical protein